MARRKVSTVESADLVPFSEILQDSKNANRGTKRGGEVIRKSLEDYGAGRSVLLDKNNRLIAGNKTLGQAAQGGIKGVRIIETDGTELIAVKRIDLDLDTDSKAKGLAVADNRASELSLDWDRDVLKSLEIDLSPFWDEKELAGLLEDKPLKTMEQEMDLSYKVIVQCDSEAHQGQLMQKLEAEGLKCLLLIS
jgi:hypothetical protein